MSSVNRDDVLRALAAVKDPKSGRNVVEAGMIQGLVVKDGKVGFAIEVTAENGSAYEPVRLACAEAVKKLPGVAQVTAVLTAERPASEPPPAPHGHGHAQAKAPVPGVAKIVAVASGKGGVGKSTTAVNLAVALSRLGLRVGLLDVDIYGPSVPKLLGLSGRPEMGADKKIVPMRAYGIVAMSIGFLLGEPDQAVIWRGPMVMGAVQQLLADVAWDAYGPIDVLIADMPPGTGDAQLTMAQRVPLAGAVIVSTPQDIALIDARKGINMFARVEVPILGVVENMSTFICPHCGGESHIFGHGGAAETAQKFGVPLLAEIPLTIDIRQTSDAGTPIAAIAPEGPQGKAYMALARAVAAKLGYPS